MKTAAILAITMVAAHPFTASADAVGGPVELNAAGLDSVTAGVSSVVPRNLAGRTLADVLGANAAPGSSAYALLNNFSLVTDTNTDDGEYSGSDDIPSAADVLNSLNQLGSGGQAPSVPASPSPSTPVIVNLPPGALEYVRNIPGTGLSVIEPIARGGQFRDFVHHQVQNQR